MTSGRFHLWWQKPLINLSPKLKVFCGLSFSYAILHNENASNFIDAVEFCNFSWEIPNWLLFLPNVTLFFCRCFIANFCFIHILAFFFFWVHSHVETLVFSWSYVEFSNPNNYDISIIAIYLLYLRFFNETWKFHEVNKISSLIFTRKIKTESL